MIKEDRVRESENEREGQREKEGERKRKGEKGGERRRKRVREIVKHGSYKIKSI